MDDVTKQDDPVTLVWVVENQPMQGEIADLAHTVDMCSLGGLALGPIYMVTDNQLRQVEMTVETGPFNEDDYAVATVTVTLLDGTRLESIFKVDGRA